MAMNSEEFQDMLVTKLALLSAESINLYVKAHTSFHWCIEYIKHNGAIVKIDWWPTKQHGREFTTKEGANIYGLNNLICFMRESLKSPAVFSAESPITIEIGSSPVAAALAIIANMEAELAMLKQYYPDFISKQDDVL